MQRKIIPGSWTWTLADAPDFKRLKAEVGQIKIQEAIAAFQAALFDGDGHLHPFLLAFLTDENCEDHVFRVFGNKPVCRPIPWEIGGTGWYIDLVIAPDGITEVYRLLDETRRYYREMNRELEVIDAVRAVELWGNEIADDGLLLDIDRGKTAMVYPAFIPAKLKSRLRATLAKWLAQKLSSRQIDQATFLRYGAQMAAIYGPNPLVRRSSYESDAVMHDNSEAGLLVDNLLSNEKATGWLQAWLRGQVEERRLICSFDDDWATKHHLFLTLNGWQIECYGRGWRESETREAGNLDAIQFFLGNQDSRMPIQAAISLLETIYIKFAEDMAAGLVSLG